jgi:hypothetical protein
MGKNERKVHGPSSLKDGWNKLARDFDLAVSLIAFPPNESILLYKVREGSWIIPSTRRRAGDGEPTRAIPCRINFSALARDTGHPRESLHRARRSLVAARVLKVDEQDSSLLTINKDYTTWVRIDPNGGDPRPMFTPDHLKFIWSAKYLATVRPISDANASSEQTDCDAAVTPPVTQPPQCTKFTVTQPPCTYGSYVTPPVTQPPQVHDQVHPKNSEISLTSTIEERAPAPAELNSIQLIQFIESYKERAREARARAKALARQERWTLAEMKAEDTRIAREFDLPRIQAELQEDVRMQEEREQMRRNKT